MQFAMNPTENVLRFSICAGNVGTAQVHAIQTNLDPSKSFPYSFCFRYSKTETLLKIKE